MSLPPRHPHLPTKSNSAPLSRSLNPLFSFTPLNGWGRAGGKAGWKYLDPFLCPSLWLPLSLCVCVCVCVCVAVIAVWILASESPLADSSSPREKLSDVTQTKGRKKEQWSWHGGERCCCYPQASYTNVWMCARVYVGNAEIKSMIYKFLQRIYASLHADLPVCITFSGPKIHRFLFL